MTPDQIRIMRAQPRWVRIAAALATTVAFPFFLGWVYCADLFQEVVRAFGYANIGARAMCVELAMAWRLAFENQTKGRTGS